MSEGISTPASIWIITEEASITTNIDRANGSKGGLLDDWDETTEVVVTRRRAIEVGKLKQEMQQFLQAMKEILEEDEQPNAKMLLNEVELSVEINGEGQISLFGVGGKAGGKGAMTFKFKRKDG